jgi:hypothetical protein
MELIMRPENGIRLSITPRAKENKEMWTAGDRAGSVFSWVLCCSKFRRY